MVQPVRNQPQRPQPLLLTAHPQANAISQMARRVLEHSFEVQLADFGAFQRFGKGDIVVLLGTSTAGKSSIISALRQIEPNRLEQGIDLACDSLMLGYIQTHFPDEYRFLQ